MKLMEDLAKIISVEAIGSAITNKNSALILSYYAPAKSKEEEIYGYFKLGGKDIPVNDSFITYCIFGVMGIIVAIALIIFFIANTFNSQIESSMNKLQAEKADIESNSDKDENSYSINNSD